MRELPEDVETSALIGALAEAWDFDVDSAEYAAVGAGSYHWVVTDLEGTRAFVTVDDLDQKPWLGDTRESAFDGLGRAFGTALALRDSGLGFVVAPIPTTRGETVRRLGLRHTIALFPFVDGHAGEYGQYEPGEPAAVLELLAELHAATPLVASTAREIDLDLPGRRRLETALREVNQTWSGGPFSEPTREALARHAPDVAELLGLLDRLSAELADRSGWVVTHGEPHAGNVIRTGQSRVLVDWDTVALAPPERDLWMLGSDTEAAGNAYFRLRWALADIASFTDMLRSPHRDGEDTTSAFDSLTSYLTAGDQWAALLD